MSASVQPVAANRRRLSRACAVSTVVGLATVLVVGATGGPASAAARPNAQAVGRFVDGSLGGMPVQKLADVVDARAVAPGSTSAQNPFDIRLFNQLNLPLSNAISIPTAPAVDAGAVNQVASARTDGRSFGASGAVADDGGASIGDDNNGTPKFASVNLTDAAFGSVPVPGLPAVPGGAPTAGLPGASALGGVTASLGAVYSNVGTRSGGTVITPASGIAGLNLTLGSPALGNLLTQLKTAFNTSALTGIVGNLTGCSLTDPTVAPIKLASGSISLDPVNAKITISVGQLLKSALGTDISNLGTSNFDLVSYLVKNLPTILSRGVGQLITSTTTELANQFKDCIKSNAALSGLLTPVINQLLAGQGQLYTAIAGLADQFSSAGGAGLTQLADGLKNVLDIGLNVQSGPGHEPRSTAYAYTSKLNATPNQNTSVVPNQTVVRAIEINLLGASGNSGVNLALGNAAAGPSLRPNIVVPTTSPAPPTSGAPNTSIPTGIPAGNAAHSTGDDGGLPVLPLVAVLVLLGVGAAAFRMLRATGWHRH